MRRKQSVLSAFAICCLFCCFTISCHKTELQSEITIDDKYTVLSTLTGAGAPQPNESTATGSFSGHFDENTGSLSFSLAWTQLSNVVQAIEIQGGSDDPITVVGFTYSRNGTLYSAVSLPAEALPNLRNGAYSVTIKTSTYPLGEIKGTLQVQ